MATCFRNHWQDKPGICGRMFPEYPDNYKIVELLNSPDNLKEIELPKTGF
jgi:hypothetical protein